MEKTFKHTVGSLKRINKVLTKRVRKQEKTLLALQDFAQRNRVLLDQSANLSSKIDNFDPFTTE